MNASILKRFQQRILTHIFLVTVTIKARKVHVKGPKGEVSQDLSHVQCDITRLNMSTKKLKGEHVRVAMWGGHYRRICAVKTVIGLINNMFVGVTEVSMLAALLRAPFIV